MTGDVVLLGLFKKHRMDSADKAFHIAMAQLGRMGDGLPAPGFFYSVSQLAGHFIRRRAGAAGVGENMHVRKAALFHKAKTLPEVLFGLSGEAYDHVGSNCATGECALQKIYTVQIAGCVIFAVHSGKDTVAAGLHGKVELGAKVGQLLHAAAEILGDHPGFQRTQSDS